MVKMWCIIIIVTLRESLVIGTAMREILGSGKEMNENFALDRLAKIEGLQVNGWLGSTYQGAGGRHFLLLPVLVELGALQLETVQQSLEWGVSGWMHLLDDQQGYLSQGEGVQEQTGIEYLSGLLQQCCLALLQARTTIMCTRYKQ